LPTKPWKSMYPPKMNLAHEAKKAKRPPKHPRNSMRE
jgi:hypothetical protein